MGTYYRPLIEEVPSKPNTKRCWINILWLVVGFSLLSWTVYEKGFLSLFIAGTVLNFTIPENLCGIFQLKQKPRKPTQSIFGTNKWVVVTCWIVAIAVFVVAILGGLGVAPFREILDALSALLASFFDRIPPWFIYLLWIVFFPVFRVVTFIERRAWLCWVWASAASLIALAILHF